jgi:uncharacterized membrane protein (DUF485 family)
MTPANLRSTEPAADLSRAGRRDAALSTKSRRYGWLLAALAIAFYVGYIAWNLYRGPL